MTAGPRLNVLVVGINYAPEQTGIGPYTAEAAEYLAALGHEVTVHTGIPHYPTWTVPGEFRRSLGQVELSAGVTVRRLRHFVPGSQDALRRGFYELTFAARVLTQPNPNTPDVVLAVVPSILSAVVAARIARYHGARLVVWVQDLMSSAATQSGIAGGSRVAGFVAEAEKRILQSAATVVLASDAFRGLVTQHGVAAERVVTIPNWSRGSASRIPPAVTRAEQGWHQDDLVVLHSGNMGLKQDLGRVAESARLARGLTRHRLLFVLMGDGNQRKELEAQCVGVDNIRLVGPVEARAYSDVLAAADMLLIHERSGVTNMSLPSKLTSYLASGRPVVAAVDCSGSTAREIRRSGGGVVTPAQTAEALVDTVLTLADQPARAAALGVQGRRYAEEHLSPEASLKRLAEVVGARESVLA